MLESGALSQCRSQGTIQAACQVGPARGKVIVNVLQRRTDALLALVSAVVKNILGFYEDALSQMLAIVPVRHLMPRGPVRASLLREEVALERVESSAGLHRAEIQPEILGSRHVVASLSLTALVSQGAEMIIEISR